MKALTLAFYSIKRMTRSRPTWVALVAAPLIAATARSIFSSSAAVMSATYACLPVCAALAWLVVHIQRNNDVQSGLSAGIASSPISGVEILSSRILAGVLIFGVQMAILATILAVRF